MITKIVEKFKVWREKRYLRRHGVETWEQFNRKFDPDFNSDSDTIAGLFRGYHSFYLVDTHYVADLFGPMPSSKHIAEWCAENCVGKYRIQELESWGFNDHSKWSKRPGEIELYVAFKEREDAINYSLFYEKPDKEYLNLLYGQLPKRTGIKY